MTNQHPITPPPELVEQWCNSPRLTWLGRLSLAYAAGADQELEACCELILSELRGQLRPAQRIVDDLRAARRPKPPSLKEQALAELAEWENVMDIASDSPIRRALEALPE